MPVVCVIYIHVYLSQQFKFIRDSGFGSRVFPFCDGSNCCVHHPIVCFLSGFLEQKWLGSEV